MIRKKRGQVEWLEFELLQHIPGLAHGVFLRHGGVSQGAFSSLNLGCAQDEGECIKRNLEKVREIIGVPLIGVYQVHGKTVKAVPQPTQGSLGEADGLMTDRNRLGLFMMHADCQTAIFYDPVHRAIANVHCGWRGNVQNIYAEAVAQMQQHYGSSPKDLLVCISPSLGPEASEFINYKQELPESFLRFQFKQFYFNLWEISRHQLLEAGILPEHIEIAGICTYSNPDDFFSFRRDKRVTGHHATLVALNAFNSFP